MIVSRTVLHALADQHARMGAEPQLAIYRALLWAAAPNTSPASAVPDDESQVIGVRHLIGRALKHASG